MSGAVVLTCVGIAVATGPAARAESTYDALANAYAVQMTLANQSIPLGLVIEGDGPAAQAKLDTNGQSNAFAAFPYPGDVAAGLPGTAGAIFGAPIPAYPFIVATQYGDEPKDQVFPGASLHAESGAHSSAAKALAGDDLAGTTSISRVDELADGSVESTANSDFHGLVLADFVKLDGFRSYARATADAFTGNVTRQTSMSFSQLSVPGLSLTIPKTTPAVIPLFSPLPGLPQPPPVNLPPIPLAMGGTTIPAPDIGFQDGTFTLTLASAEHKYAVPASMVFDAFEKAGVTLSYQAPQKLDTGVRGAAFDLTFTMPAPPKSSFSAYFDGPTKITYTVGRSTALANLRQADAATGGVGGASTLGTASGIPGASGIGGINVGAVPSALGAAGPVDALPGTANAAVAAPMPVTEFDTISTAASVSPDGFGDVGRIYLVLFGAALVAVGAAVVLGMFGVRFLWSS